ncbi:hypothetical protein Bhyg_05217, partial [Pseudolycoriella hygida]
QYQSFAEFETELRKQMQYCAYKCSSTTCQATFDERMLRDRIIVGVYDEKLQLKLLDGRNESLADVIDKCKVFEIAHQHKNILDDKSSTVASIASDIQANINALDQPKRLCFNCGQLWHKEHVLICKTKYAMCRKCTKKGHFAVMCRQMEKKPHQTQSSNGKINLNKQTVGTLLWSDITVVSNEFEPILGLYTCVELEIVKRADIDVISLPNSTESFLEQYKDVFTGCGKFPGEYKIYLKENSKPVVHYRKRIPHALLSPLKIELDKMLQDGIISSVDYPTDWVHNLQIHEKSNGKLRICLDPKPLNNCIKREHFLIPTIQDLMSCLAYSTVFSPVVHYRKRIPHALLSPLKIELDKMLQDGIISSVDYPTDWVHNLQIHEKSNGKLRICLDPKPLNNCIKREHFLIPTIQDLMSCLAYSTVFS